MHLLCVGLGRIALLGKDVPYVPREQCLCDMALHGTSREARTGTVFSDILSGSKERE